MDGGELIADLPDLAVSADRSARQLACLPEGTLRLHNPHIYKVSISPGLHKLREQLMAEHEL